MLKIAQFYAFIAIATIGLIAKANPVIVRDTATGSFGNGVCVSYLPDTNTSEVLTTAHGTWDARTKSLVVEYKGTKYPAEVIAFATDYDLGLLRVPDAKIPTVKVGASPKVGEALFTHPLDMNGQAQSKTFSHRPVAATRAKRIMHAFPTSTDSGGKSGSGIYRAVGTKAELVGIIQFQQPGVRTFYITSKGINEFFETIRYRPCPGGVCPQPQGPIHFERIGGENWEGGEVKQYEPPPPDPAPLPRKAPEPQKQYNSQPQTQPQPQTQVPDIGNKWWDLFKGIGTSAAYLAAPEFAIPAGAVLSGIGWWWNRRRKGYRGRRYGGPPQHFPSGNDHPGFY